VGGCVRFPGDRWRWFARDELGDAVAERVGGVVVRKTAHARCPVQDA